MDSFKFPKPHQYTTVANGETKQIYYYKIPEGYVGFIESVGTLWVLNSKLVWLIDNENVETNDIERGINTPNIPQKFSPPIVARYSIEFQLINNSGSSMVMEVLCDGMCVRVPISDDLR